MGNPVGWFEIYVEDMARAKTFYESVLGISLQQMSDPSNSGAEMWGFPFDFEGHGTSGALVKMEGYGPSADGTIIYFVCEDCSEQEARVASAGGKVLQPKMSIGVHGFCAIAQDTEGNTIGLHSNK